MASTQRFERRFEPFFRPALNATLREPSARVIQAMINRQRRNEDRGMALAEERIDPEAEEAALDSIIRDIAAYLRQQYKPGEFQRGGNTKTHGVVRGEVIIRDDVPAHMRKGIFAEPRTYRAWVRFSGPGPDSPRDIDDVGFVSCAIKMMGVPRPKLLDDEAATQDLICVCTPTFVTPNITANTVLQASILRGTPAFYFFRPRQTHLLDLLMQSWWNQTQTNPLEQRYWSCVPYLLGEGQAMMYSFRPKAKPRSRIPRLPLRPPDNYLRDNMVATLAERDVEFDIMVQVQTDAHRMPIENAAVRWPEKLSPFVPVATLRIPKQKFDSPRQLAFAHNLSYNPWHCLPEHRPLGNQGRARKRMYTELSKLRQEMNQTPHIEPTGDEAFD
ncbi:MAG: catalase family protein [Chloroflexi bacterium]|nr:catalase family protein [Chloroflexota bacterium]